MSLDGATPVQRRTLSPRLERWLPVLVFAIALLPRLWAPSPFITWDEPVWTYRSLKFLRSLQTGRFSETNLTAHPGVLTMWAGASGVAARTGFTGDGDLSWVDDLPPFDEDDVALVSTLMPWWRAARPGVGVVTALLIAGAYMLLVRLTDRWTALLASTLLAFDPYVLGHSRVLHLDAVTALAMLGAILCTLAHVRGGARRHLLLAGALGGLAMVEKSPAAFVAPFSLLLLLGGAPSRAADRGGGWLPIAIRDVALWGLVAGLAYAAVWPAMWVAPLDTLAGMWTYATASAGGAREAVFFRGAVQPDPGLALYVAAVPFRLTPLACVGLVAAIPFLVGHRRTTRRRDPGADRSLVIVLLAFAVLFALFMGSGAKKFERYILPALPPLDVVAAVGLVGAARLVAGAARRATSERGRQLVGLALAGAVGLQVLATASAAPHYLAVYNPVLGGGPEAARVLPVGWGEGMDLAAAYLNAKDDAGGLVVSTPSVPLLAPFFVGHTVGARRWDTADYVVLYVDDVQIRRPAVVESFHGHHQPEHVVRLNGIEYAWIYAR